MEQKTKTIVLLLVLLLMGCGMPMRMPLPEPLETYFLEFEEHFNTQWHGDTYVSDDLACPYMRGQTPEAIKDRNAVMCRYNTLEFNIYPFTDRIIFNERILDYPDEYLWYVTYHELGHYYFMRNDHDERRIEVWGDACNDKDLRDYFNGPAWDNFCSNVDSYYTEVNCPISPMGTKIHHDIIAFCVNHFGKEFYRHELWKLSEYNGRK